MEAPSVLGHRSRVPWTGLLLAVSLSTFWIPPVTAQVTVEPEPANVAEGKDVLLRVYNLSEEPLKYDWYKGKGVDKSQAIISYRLDTQNTIPGPMYSSRETIYPSGSLLIRNVTKNDTGDYYVLVLYNNSLTSDGESGRFQVLEELPKPNITSNNSDPVEHKDTVVLTCGPETPDTTYLWSINSQSLPDSDRMQLSKDNRTLTLLRVTRTDTGPYVCETWNPVSAHRSDPFTLNVLYGPDTPTISPSESNYHTGQVLNLTCHAASHPPAHYSWLINGSHQQSTQVLFISNITKSNSGSYTCLAYNNATGLNSTTVKVISVSVSLAQPFIQANSTHLTEHKDSVALTCITRDTGIFILWLFNNNSLQPTNRRMLSEDNRTLTISPIMSEDIGEYQCEVSIGDIAVKSSPFTLTVISAEPGSPGLSPGAIAGIVIGVLAGVALIGGLGYFLYRKRTGGTIDHRDLTENKLSASSHSQDHSDNLTNKTDEVAYSSLTFNAQGSKTPVSSCPSPAATETVYSEVKRK
ncbi:carcinoembryonic antigen-related cell adhesion molecule 1 [Talpa occidentalis]|uniref:carcinoembryonic antigen-related cell adhesion molecule 1 n=1 Tax=Talpa occidentalis TaxID=50954 RepID=UPI00188F4E96|nr:carcinoembryonic antigen-related cell adhesion molecule 1 [Talpa occidentalis]